MHCLRTQTFTSDVTTNLHTLKTVDCAGHSCKIIGQFKKKTTEFGNQSFEYTFIRFSLLSEYELKDVATADILSASSKNNNKEATVTTISYNTRKK